MILNKENSEQLADLFDKYKGVNSCGNYHIVTHVCCFKLGIPLDEITFGNGTLKECMSDRDVNQLKNVSSEHLIDSCDITTLNAISMACGFGVLDCVLIEDELNMMWLRGEHNSDTEFFTEVKRLAEQADGA